ncbi:hypothetical protein FRC07_001632, partial [Ceratobasidium sp. 392]
MALISVCAYGLFGFAKRPLIIIASYESNRVSERWETRTNETTKAAPRSSRRLERKDRTIVPLIPLQDVPAFPAITELQPTIATCRPVAFFPNFRVPDWIPQPPQLFRMLRVIYSTGLSEVKRKFPTTPFGMRDDDEALVDKIVKRPRPKGTNVLGLLRRSQNPTAAATADVGPSGPTETLDSRRGPSKLEK